MVKKHLIFSFFIPNDYESNIAITTHYACLCKYCEVFDSAEFFLSYTEESKRYVSSVKLNLLDVFKCKDIRFKEIENDCFNESRVLKDYVIDRLPQFDNTMVFFGHTKGTSDISRGLISEEQLTKWIFGCYFYSLEFIYEAEKKLFSIFHGRAHTFFGSFPMINESGRCFLSGNFYWINPMALRKDILDGEIVIPNMWNRAYAEDLPTLYKRTMCDGFPMCKTGGHNCIEGDWKDLYFYETDFEKILDCYGDKDYFIKKYNELMVLL